MIKGKLPYPFETIALAVSFTPGLPFLISEMQRLCELHKAIAIFIHVGKKTSDKQKILATLLSSCGFHDGNSRIYWEPAETVNSILQICKHEVADLLITGASERENFRLPIGQVTSGLATKAKCSVLIYSGQLNGGFKKIVVNGAEHKKTDMTVMTSVYFAEMENVTELNIAGENASTSYSEMIDDYTKQAASKNSNDVNEAIDKIKITNFSLSNENCESISEYAFKNSADLIITHSSNHRLLIFDRISSSDSIENMLKELPCNLLIVHSRIPD